MKILMTILIFISCYTNAEIRADFGSGLAKQIYSGQQPNDRPTPFVDLNVYVEAESDFSGIRTAIGYEFKCIGDNFPNKEQEVDSTSKKILNSSFDSVKPLFYDQWSTAVIDTRNCYLTWSASAIGTTTSSGSNIGFEIFGSFGNILLNFTNSNTSPEYRKAKGANSIFAMYKEPDC